MNCEVAYSDERLIVYLYQWCSSDPWRGVEDFLSDGTATVSECEVNFSRTNFIDDRGLRGLMALKEKLGRDVPITLTNTSYPVRAVLSAAQLGRMFTIG